MAVNTVIELAGVDDELAMVASAWLSKLQALFEECLCEAGYSAARAAEYGAYLMVVNEGVRVASRRKLPRRQSLEAIDTALRAAVSQAYPNVDRIHLTDYKVRILDGATATGAVTRVLIDATDGERSWTTIGVSSNIIEASWRALEESLIYGLLHSGV
jgi:Glu-tRNA(Gln) amidotransferase subunit E-like FAD-binding protein